MNVRMAAARTVTAVKTGLIDIPRALSVLDCDAALVVVEEAELVVDVVVVVVLEHVTLDGIS